MNQEIKSIDQVEEGLRQEHYIADRSLATSIFLSVKLKKPLFLEGEAGVGKTEVAKVLASMLKRKLIRLQCYEGLDVNTAVYEWNYSRQMLQIRLLEASGNIHQESTVQDIFGPEFLLKRPLLQAIDGTEDPAPVLLVDELDRADEEFEAFLLEVLSDFQISIPEIGTIKAEEPPIVLITSNRTREIHDALKRRCLYYWIDYPSFEKEHQIILAKVPEAPQHLAGEVVAFVQELRREDLYKRPGVAETLDWVSALVALDQKTLTEEMIEDTLGALLKYQDDLEHTKGPVTQRILSQRAGVRP
ncbi:MoxR family ATPase [Acidobacteria bacterium AH-259-O06]|nr:MoxR family ATPase [Acidobacteria bacterium AH-259-O06]